MRKADKKIRICGGRPILTPRALALNRVCGNLEGSMQHYEIRVLKDNGSLSLKMANDYINANAAIAAGRRISRGSPFEVWRGDTCVYANDRAGSPYQTPPPGARLRIEPQPVS